MFTKNKRIVLTILSLIGLCLTAELIHIYFKVNFAANAAPSFCTVNNIIDCDGVAKTNYSLFLGIPLAIWGTLLYLLILFLTYIDKLREVFKNSFIGDLLSLFKNPSSYIATFGLISFTISMVLAGISIFKIQKICALCFVTYILDLIIAIYAKNDRFFINDIKNTVADFIQGVKKYTALFILAVIIVSGILIYTQTSAIFSPALRDMKSFKEFQKMDKNPYYADGNTLGNPDGEIIIYAYSDFMCPFCKVTNIMIHKLVQEEKDVVVYHMNFPLDSACNINIRQTVHPGSCILAKYALAAENQGSYWGMTNEIFDNMPSDENQILELAKKIGMDEKLLYKDAHSKEIDEILKRQIQRAMDAGIKGTPTLIIDGIEYQSAMPYPKIKILVKQARNRHKNSK